MSSSSFAPLVSFSAPSFTPVSLTAPVAAPTEAAPIAPPQLGVKKGVNRHQKAIDTLAKDLAKSAILALVGQDANLNIEPHKSSLRQLQDTFTPAINVFYSKAASVDVETGEKIVRQRKPSGYLLYGEWIRQQQQNELETVASQTGRASDLKSTDEKVAAATKAEIQNVLINHTQDNWHKRIHQSNSLFSFHSKCWKALSETERTSWNERARVQRERDFGPTVVKDKQRALQPYNIFTTELSRALHDRTNQDANLVYLRRVHDAYFAANPELRKSQLYSVVWHRVREDKRDTIYIERAAQEKAEFLRTHPEKAGRSEASSSSRQQSRGEELFNKIGKIPI